MTEGQIPLWVEIITAIFVLLGAAVALLGASGVVRLNSFFARVHAPAVVTTVGIWCILIATIAFFTALNGRVPINTLLIGLFISVTAPVTTIFLMRAALFRSRQRGEDVPASINVLKLAVPQKEPEPEELAAEAEAEADNAADNETETDLPDANARAEQPDSSMTTDGSSNSLAPDADAAAPSENHQDHVPARETPKS